MPIFSLFQDINNFILSADIGSSVMNTKSNEGAIMIGIRDQSFSSIQIGYVYKKISSKIKHKSKYNGLRAQAKAQLLPNAGFFLDFDYLKGESYVFKGQLSSVPDIKSTFIGESTFGIFINPLPNLGLHVGYMVYSYDPSKFERDGSSPHRGTRNIEFKLNYTLDLGCLFSSEAYGKRMWME